MKTFLVILAVLFALPARTQETPVAPENIIGEEHCITEAYFKNYFKTQNLKFVVMQGEDLYQFNKAATGKRLEKEMDEVLVVFFDAKGMLISFQDNCYEASLDFTKEQYDAIILKVEQGKA